MVDVVGLASVAMVGPVVIFSLAGIAVTGLPLEIPLLLCRVFGRVEGEGFCSVVWLWVFIFLLASSPF